MLGLEVVYIQDYLELGEIIFETKEIEDSINIYELMHLMKEWAYSKEYTIQSWIFGQYDKGKAKVIGIISSFETKDNTPLINANTEFEAVTLACMWILKEQK